MYQSVVAIIFDCEKRVWCLDHLVTFSTPPQNINNDRHSSNVPNSPKFPPDRSSHWCSCSCSKLYRWHHQVFRRNTPPGGACYTIIPRVPPSASNSTKIASLEFIVPRNYLLSSVMFLSDYHLEIIRQRYFTFVICSNYSMVEKIGLSSIKR